MYITSHSRSLPHRLIKTRGLQSKSHGLSSDKNRETIEAIYSFNLYQHVKSVSKTGLRKGPDIKDVQQQIDRGKFMKTQTLVGST